MKHFLLFSNTNKALKKVINKVCDALTKAGYSFRLVHELGSCDLSGYSDIILIGGDGTINLAINQLNSLELPIGIIPAGSGNDYVKSMNIGRSLPEQIHTSINGNLKQVDVGQCGDRLFVNGFGLGFDGQIAKSFEENRTILRGHAAYYYHVLKTLSGFKPLPLQFTVDGEAYEEEVLLLTIAKGTTFGGGFKLTPHSNLSDGEFAISLIRDLKPLRRFLNIHRLQRGSHLGLDEVEFLKGKVIVIQHQPKFIAHVDGELIGSPPFKIKILPKKLNIKVSS